MSEQPQGDNTLTPNPDLVIENLKMQLAQKSNEAASNWAVAQQVHMELLASRQALEAMSAELEDLRRQLNEATPFVPDEAPAPSPAAEPPAAELPALEVASPPVPAA